MQGNSIHIAFYQNEVTKLALLGKVESKQILAFIKNKCLRRVEVLWGRVIHNSSAKADDISPGVNDGEHQTVTETVVNAAVFLRNEACIPQLLVSISLCPHSIAQAVPGVGGKTDTELGQCTLGHTALLGIGKTFCTHRGIQLAVEITGSFFHQRPQALLLAVAALILFVLRHFHTNTLCQLTNSIGIAQSLYFHYKVDGTATLMAAEAVVDALVGGNGERGCLFSMERAKAKQIGTGTLQAHILSYHIFNWIAGDELVNKTGGKCHGLCLLSVTRHEIATSLRSPQ